MHITWFIFSYKWATSSLSPEFCRQMTAFSSCSHFKNCSAAIKNASFIFAGVSFILRQIIHSGVACKINLFNKVGAFKTIYYNLWYNYVDHCWNPFQGCYYWWLMILTYQYVARKIIVLQLTFNFVNQQHNEIHGNWYSRNLDWKKKTICRRNSLTQCDHTLAFIRGRYKLVG